MFGADNVKWEKSAGQSKNLSVFDDYAKTPFLPDEYYARKIDVKNFYQEPNTAREFVRIGEHSRNWEKSITVSDNYGRLKYRIDCTDHGLPQDHLNIREHVHVYEINTDSPKTVKNGIKWYSDDNFWYKKSRPSCQPLDVIK